MYRVQLFVRALGVHSHAFVGLITNCMFNYLPAALREYRLMVNHLPSKQVIRVRSPLFAFLRLIVKQGILSCHDLNITNDSDGVVVYPGFYQAAR